MAVVSKLVPAAISAFGFQTICAAIFVPRQDDRFYDVAGALGFLSTTYISLYYPGLKAKYLHGTPLPPLGSFAPRQLLLSAAVGLWSIRLGSYLISRRNSKVGEDSKFDEIKRDPATFTAMWMAQAAWVFIVGLPVYMTNVLPSNLHAPIGPRDYASLGLFAGSLLLETLADGQKSAWRRAKENREHHEKFIHKGLWGSSRHPNYVGEVGVWTGIWALSTGSLQSLYFPSYTPLLALVSPVTTYTFLRYVSGVPLSEKYGDRKFGDDPKWKEYKRQVPVFWPWGFRK